MMSKDEKLNYLLKLNETGNTSVIDNIIRLIMDGYEVTFLQGIVAGIENGTTLPAVCVTVTLNGEWVTEDTAPIVSDAMTEVFQMTPEVK